MPAVVGVEGLGKRYAVVNSRRRALGERLREMWNGAAQRDLRWALRNIDLTVERGEFVGILGKNGSGKSSLLRLIGGIGAAEEGRIEVTGSIAGLLDLSTGLQPDLTGRENAITAAMVAGASEMEAQAGLAAVADFAEMGEYLDEPVRTYSSGMKMRLAFSVAIHTGAELLLIDEYLSVGDLAFREKCWRRLEELKAAGRTMLLATHDLTPIRQLCDRAIWLDQGRLRLEGDARAVADSYAEAYRALPGASTQTAKTPIQSVPFERDRLKISGVTVEPETPRPGSAITMTIAYDRIDANLEAAVFSLRLTDSTGNVYFATNSTASPQTHRLVSSGTVRVCLERLDIQPGSYFVDVGAHRPDFVTAYDYQWHRYPLEILGYRPAAGLLSPPHHWEAGGASNR
jgi:lipopolysaccharide transport system ATP-binding protein